MRATVTVDVDIKHARTALMIAGYDVSDKTDEEICENEAIDTKQINEKFYVLR